MSDTITTIHVSVNGDDSAPGTADRPFATLQRARNEAAALLREDAGRAVNVQIGGGTYHLKETLELGGDISGTEETTVTFTAVDGERVVISGGEPVTGWERDPVYDAQLNGGAEMWRADTGRRDVFRTLRVGDKLATRARYPKADPTDRIRGGWAFADWWGFPWERGRFEQPVRTLRRAGDFLQWTVDVPGSGLYRVWIAYIKDESTTHPTVSSAFGTRGGERACLEPLGAAQEWAHQNTGKSLHAARGAGEAFMYLVVGEVRLEQGTQELYWENVSGGAIDLDAIVLCSDPSWDAGKSIRIVAGHPRTYEVDEPAEGHYLVLQAEAFSSASDGVVLPSIEPSGAPMAEPGGRRDLITMREEDSPFWTDWSGVEVNVFPGWGWHNRFALVERYDAESRTIHFESGYDIRPGNRYFLTGICAMLTDAGEWHLDAQTGMVRYAAPAGAGEPPTTVAARLKTAIRLTGAHIHLRNLVFSDTDYSIDAARAGSDAAIELIGATDCVVSGCSFEHVNGWAVRLLQRSTRNLIERCTMHELGQGGVELSGDDYTQPTENRVVANDIADCGRVYAHVAGVYGTASSRNLISHNRIHRMPRYAISFKSGRGRGAYQNIIEYNDLRHMNLETSDTGGVEIYGGSTAITGNVIRYNRISNSVGLKVDHRGSFVSPVYAWGVYLDDWCSGVTIHGNIIDGNVVGGVNMHGGCNNLVQNNILVNGHSRQLSLAAIFSDRSSRSLRDNVIRCNVVAYSNRTARLVWTRAGRWSPECLLECDYNLYWFLGEPLDLESPDIDITPVGSLPRWRELGFDCNSRVADPLFVDADAGDYTLQEDSPAYAMGFQRIPVEKIGPEGYEPEGS